MRKAVNWLTRPVWSWLELIVISSVWGSVYDAHIGWLARDAIGALGVAAAILITYLLRRAAKLPTAGSAWNPAERKPSMTIRQAQPRP